MALLCSVSERSFLQAALKGTESCSSQGRGVVQYKKLLPLESTSRVGLAGLWKDSGIYEVH